MIRISFELPILTVSEANSSEHWRAKAERHKSQQDFVYLAMKRHAAKVRLPCEVKMVRLAPRELDEDDNLRMAFKWIKDEISEFLIPDARKTYINARGRVQQIKGRADSDKRIKWHYGQEKAQIKGIRIEIQFEEDDEPHDTDHE